MSQITPYPHCVIEVEDRSIYTPVSTRVLPLFIPFFALKTEKGKSGVPQYFETMQALTTAIGSQTFDEKSKYFSYAAYFLQQHMNNGGKAWVARLTDSDWHKAGIKLQAKYSTGNTIQKYMKEAAFDAATIDGVSTVGYANDNLRTTINAAGSLININEPNEEYCGIYNAGTSANPNYQVSKSIVLPVHGVDAAGHPCYKNNNGRLTAYNLESLFNNGYIDSDKVKYKNCYLYITDSITGLPAVGEASLSAGKLFKITRGTKASFQTNNTWNDLHFDADWVEASNSDSSAVAATGTEINVANACTVKTATGIKVSWTFAQATQDDIINSENGNLGNTSNIVADTFYDIAVVSANGAGDYGKNLGMRFYYNANNQDATRINNTKSIFYSFEVFSKDANTTKTTTLRNANGNNAVDFSLNKGCVDNDYAIALDPTSRLANAYPEDTQYALPYNVNFLSNNVDKFVKKVFIACAGTGNKSTTLEANMTADDYALFSGNAVTDTQKEQLANTYAYLLNIVSGIEQGFEAAPYNFLSVAYTNDGDTTDSTMNLTSSTDHYLLNPASINSLESNLTAEATEALYRSYLTNYEEAHLQDNARYPFKYLVDTGYALETKCAMINFTTVREDVKLLLSTWIGNEDNANAGQMENEEAVGARLTATANSVQESVANGTDCCRVTVIMQAGIPSGWNRWVPEVLWLMLKKTSYMDRTYFYKYPNRYPESLNTLFKKHNWIPDTAFLQSKYFQGGYNYCQYFDQDQLFYPAIRSIYPATTSVLTNDNFTDVVVGAKGICWTVWAEESGNDDSQLIVAENLRSKTLARITAMLNGKGSVEVNVYQTLEDQKLGYINRINVTITWGAMQYVNVFNIICKRENYNDAEA